MILAQHEPFSRFTLRIGEARRAVRFWGTFSFCNLTKFVASDALYLGTDSGCFNGTRQANMLK